jgi:hypothetical protein
MAQGERATHTVCCAAEALAFIHIVEGKVPPEPFAWGVGNWRPSRDTACVATASSDQVLVETSSSFRDEKRARNLQNPQTGCAVHRCRRSDTLVASSGFDAPSRLKPSDKAGNFRLRNGVPRGEITRGGTGTDQASDFRLVRDILPRIMFCENIPCDFATPSRSERPVRYQHSLKHRGRL